VGSRGAEQDRFILGRHKLVFQRGRLTGESRCDHRRRHA
jgi:hypothetical protein